MYHCDIPIVFHKNESTGTVYKDELIFSRVAVFKKIWSKFGGGVVFYFTIFKYQEYKNKYSFFKYF